MTEYSVTLTSDQIFSFSELVRRLNSHRSQDSDSTLRQELVDALYGFANLLPEPSDEDGDAYLEARAAGEVPNWDRDELPLTETTAEWVAGRHPEYAAEDTAPAAEPAEHDETPSFDRHATVRRAIALIDEADPAVLPHYIAQTNARDQLKASPAAFRNALKAAAATKQPTFGTWKLAQQLLHAAGLPH